MVKSPVNWPGSAASMVKPPVYLLGSADSWWNHPLIDRDMNGWWNHPLIYCFVIQPIWSSPANSVRRGELPRLYLWLQQLVLSVQLGLNNTRLLVPVQYYFILHQATIEQCRQQQDTSQAAMLADGVMAAKWPRRRVQWCSPRWCTGSVERLNWKH